MDGDISKALTYQVKREIAEKYFGWRTAIFEDISELEKMVAEAQAFYEARVGRDLLRIYSLLSNESLISRFLQMCGWSDRPFYDAYVVDSPTIRERLLKDIERHGWTDSGRFKNLVRDAYRRLVRSCAQYKEKLAAVEEEVAVVKEELRRFKEKFSLDEIMGFLRSLDQDEGGDSLAMTPLALGSERLEERLAFPSVEHLEEALASVPDLPDPGKIDKKLKDLAERAFMYHKAARTRLPLRGPQY